MVPPSIKSACDSGEAAAPTLAFAQRETRRVSLKLWLLMQNQRPVNLLSPDQWACKTNGPVKWESALMGHLL